MRTHSSLQILSMCLLILTATSVFLLTRGQSAEALFKRIVISPIPESVKDIKASVPLDMNSWGFRQHTYILRFDIRRDDLQKLLLAGNFVEWDVKYYDFRLDYTAPNGIGSGISLYETKREVPDWFDLGKWDFTAYYSGKEVPVNMYIDVHILLYNDDFGCAYFIDHEVEER